MNKTLETLLAAGLAGYVAITASGCASPPNRHESNGGPPVKTPARAVPIVHTPTPAFRAHATPTPRPYGTLAAEATPATLIRLAPTPTPTPIPTEVLERNVGFSFAFYDAHNDPIKIPGSDMPTKETGDTQEARYIVTQGHDGAIVTMDTRPAYMIVYPEGSVYVARSKGTGSIFTRILNAPLNMIKKQRPFELGIVLYRTEKQKDGTAVSQKYESKKGGNAPLEVQLDKATEIYMYSTTGDVRSGYREQLKPSWLNDPDKYWHPLRSVAMGTGQAGYRLNLAAINLPTLPEPTPHEKGHKKKHK